MRSRTLLLLVYLSAIQAYLLSEVVWSNPLTPPAPRMPICTGMVPQPIVRGYVTQCRIIDPSELVDVADGCCTLRGGEASDKPLVVELPEDVFAPSR